MVAESPVLQLESEYDVFFGIGAVADAELWRLGSLADTIASNSRGPHRLLAYILRSVLFDVAQKAEGLPIVPETAGLFFAAMDPPIRLAIKALKGPLSVGRTLDLAEHLLDARGRVIKRM